MMRFCPNCESERPLNEQICLGEVAGEACHWNLVDVPVRAEGWRPEPVVTLGDGPQAARAAVVCENGHPLGAGDLLCSVCGAEITTAEAPGDLDDSPGGAEPPPTPEPTVIEGWRLDGQLKATSEVSERYAATRLEDGHQAILSLYAPGKQPDIAIYEALQTVNREHVPDILATGRWQDRAFEVAEDLKGGTLADLGLLPDDLGTLHRVVDEIGSSLHALAEKGIRHRDLNPGAILVRAREPLDLVISEFGSARLSEFDLDVVSPLEMTRYTAPEAVAGGVAAASDWWSLGMVLLEQVTRGACFEGVNDQAFLIHVLANGAPIPEGLDPWLEMLLLGLLARDRRERWGWDEAQAWLAGESPPVPVSSRAQPDTAGKRTITLGGRPYSSARSFALAAADPQNWDEALTLLGRGVLATWMEDAGLDANVQAEVRQLAHIDGITEDLRLGLALKALNEAMPLVCRGEIVTPAWLLDNPEAGYSLIAGPVPVLLKRKDAELWLARLKDRAELVRERAKQLDIAMNEAELRVHLLATSKSRLSAMWDDRRRLLPDTDHPGLIAILERRQTSEEDYILLLSADLAQFRTSEAIVAEAADIASRAGVPAFDDEAASAWLQKPRREIFHEIDRRLEGFARCGLERVDDWADQFRMERRLSIGRSLALLAVSEDAWLQPPKQTYIADLLEFFSRKLGRGVMRGPLSRMIIGKTTARVDLSELDGLRSAATILDHLLLRNGQPIEIDSGALTADPRVERRMRLLYSHATLYRRDTGIDGLYLGFPFLFMQDAKSTAKPRIAPVLLWPIKLHPEVGARGRITISFDGREEVRLNPAFEGIVGPEAAERWEEVARDILGRASLAAADVMDAFAQFAQLPGRTLIAMPAKDATVRPGQDQVICSAALFHLTYLGQAVMRDIRNLKGRPPAGTALETALKVADRVERRAPERVAELQRFFTADTDPSQEQAVVEARNPPGLLVEGPPGTGKSQTIVNMVADAIGQKKSVLIVCQKQPALDVVHKRLLAEGLGDRLVMIKDIVKDRRTVITSVRDQVAAVFASASGGYLLRQKREQTAARLDALAGELDQHHQALHAYDAQTSLTYRLILGDLIGLEDAALPSAIDAPALRKLVGPMDVAQVAALEQACGPLARYWLPSAFEGSALAVLTPFAPDAGNLASFNEDFEALCSADAARMALITATPAALWVSDPDSVRAWAIEHQQALLNLADSRRGQLARWLDHFHSATAEADTAGRLADLDEIITGLRALPERPIGTRTAAEAVGLASGALNMAVTLADELLLEPSFLGRLSPARWLKRRRMVRYLEEKELGALAAWRQALYDEQTLRPWRLRLAEARQALGEPLAGLEALPPQDLADLAAHLRADFAEAAALGAMLTSHPLGSEAFAAAATGTREAFAEFLARADQGCHRYEARQRSLTALANVEDWFVAEWREARANAIGQDRSNEEHLNAVTAARVTLADYLRFRARAAQLGPDALDCFARLRPLEAAWRAVPESELNGEVRRTIGREARLAWKSRLETATPSLAMESSELEAKAEAFASADEEMKRLNRLLLMHVDATALQPIRKWDDITKLTGQRARRLREFVDMGAELGLMSVRPIWLMNPDVASRVLPLKSGLFDIVIYDEASQMPVEYALPGLYRSKVVIVSGDEKQMPPTNFFNSKIESDEAGIFEEEESEEPTDEERAQVEETWNRREIKDCPDLLQLAKTVLHSSMLKVHYRSIYRELIQYSNAAFYQNSLSVPARHPDAEICRIRPIEVVRVDGVYTDQTNEAEAEAVAAELARLWAQPNAERKSVGVVTFNRKQADLIDEVLEEHAERSAVFRQALAEERERVEDGEDMSFFVKNVENVQGDERDVIVFSSTFGRNAQGAFKRYFGVLGQVGGERRLNVAVSRAREKVILVTSMPVADISDFLSARRAAESPRDYLQAYFEYARAISNGELDTARSLLDRITDEQRNTYADAHEVDGFEEAVAAYVGELGWSVEPVLDSGAFGLDFAIEDPRTGIYGIGIECDAPRHSLLSHARARELWRPQVFRRGNLRVHRVSSHGWYHSPEDEKARLREAIEAALDQGVAA